MVWTSKVLQELSHRKLYLRLWAMTVSASRAVRMPTAETAALLARMSSLMAVIGFKGHGGFVVGSEMSGGVKNVMVTNCQFLGTDVGLRFKSARGRGGVVENILHQGYVNV